MTKNACNIDSNYADRRNRIVAFVATMLIFGVCVILLMSLHLYYHEDVPVPPDNEILLGGEYVRLGNFAEAQNHADAPAESGDNVAPESHDLVDAGDGEHSSEEISLESESEMKVAPREEQKGPAAVDDAKIEKEKRQKETQAKIHKRVNFNGVGKSEGSAGVPYGKSNASELSGAASFNLKGRSAEYFDFASSGVDGKIVIEVRVNPQGKVIEAHYRSGSGSAAASAEVRRSCEQASLRSRFSSSREIATDQIGTITWTFE